MLTSGVTLTLGDRSARTPVLLGWVSSAYDVPEALAVPLARTAGGGAQRGHGRRGCGLGSRGGYLTTLAESAPAST